VTRLSSEFFGYDDEPEAFGSAPEFHVDREQAAAEDVCERDVLGVVGARPSELTGEAPGFLTDADVLYACDRRLGERGAGGLSLLCGQLAAPLAVMQDRVRLRPQQRRSDERLLGKCPKAGRGDARLDRDVRVNRERQRPWRDCCSQATTFGIGSPHAVLSQPQLAGALAISAGSPVTAPLALPRAAVIDEWSFSTSLCRRSLRVTPQILAPATQGRHAHE
jgi:hypothetical protein